MLRFCCMVPKFAIQTEQNKDARSAAELAANIVTPRIAMNQPEEKKGAKAVAESVADIAAAVGRHVLGKDAPADKVLELLQGEVNKLNDQEPLFKQIRRVVLRTEPFVKNTSAKIKRFEADNKRLN